MKKKAVPAAPPPTPATEGFYREAMMYGFTPKQAAFLLNWFDMYDFDKRAQAMQEESDEMSSYEWACREAGVEPQPWDLVKKFEKEPGR